MFICVYLCSCVFVSYCIVVRQPDISQGGMNEFYLFLFYQSTILSSGEVDGHQMYFGGSVLGKSFNNWFRHLAHHSPNFCRVSRSAKFGVVFSITQLWAARV